MEPIEKFFTKDQLHVINSDLKFFGAKKLDNVKMNFGMETLYYVSMLEATLNTRSKNPSGKRLLDLLDSFHSMEETLWKSILELRRELFGAEYVKKCCYYTIYRGYAMDTDIVKILQSFHKEPKKLKNKKKKQKALK